MFSCVTPSGFPAWDCRYYNNYSPSGLKSQYPYHSFRYRKRRLTVFNGGYVSTQLNPEGVIGL